ncbi:unnamed protein product [Diabrotica balteata]|uniref:Indole-3-acetaldehyde oxidase n=1 Tax=Diabrotica balteata TaxID=107213 RepID=A0A9N9T9M9_DIABA|nr:unnamed protein product [Diabrotica balteata]
MELHEDLNIFVNGQFYKVLANELSPTTTLNSFLRNHLHLTGTKRMCLEGGCGACLVAVKRQNATTKEDEIVAVNSCLVSIFSTVGWEIYTIEGLGDTTNPNKLQQVIAKFYGTQCGYCTPGMIMNMFALKQNTKDVMMETVENSFGGNICRCTGYRPILEAFKSVCQDASPDLAKKCGDIEDMPLCKMKLKYPDIICSPNLSSPFYYKLGGLSWIKVTLLNDLIQIIKTFESTKNGNPNYYTIVAGNTSKGVYKKETEYNVYVDIQDVPELKSIRLVDNGLRVGANITLTTAISTFKKMSQSIPQLKYLKKLADHIDLVANVPVRNIGTLAGNLMIKHKNNEFPSDIFLVLETVNATLQIIDTEENEKLIKPREFLKMDMENRIIKSIFLPYLSKNYYFESFKIMKRSQNTHASLNTAFLLKISDDKLVEEANIVIGTLGSKIHASDSEKFIIGKNIFKNDILQQVFKRLDGELNPENDLMHPSPEYSKKSTISLFYKYILSIAPQNLLTPSHVSGKSKLKRPISKSKQEYEIKENMYPISYPVTKKEAMLQATGEAEYISDMPDLVGQLHAAFVLAKAKPLSRIIKVDTEKAMKLDGVVAFFDKNDIPGRNTFTPIEAEFLTFYHVEEELFCSGVVQYDCQPIGVIVAKSQDLAEKAAELVEVVYEKTNEKNLHSIKDVLKNNAMERIREDTKEEPIQKGANTEHIVNGKVELGWQSHFYMETQCCNVVYKDDGLDMYASTQWMDSVQTAASVVLKIPANKINVIVKRIGGAFGGKLVRHGIVSSAAAVAAYKLKKPVKLWLPIEKNFAIIGKRNPVLSNYEVGTDRDGNIQFVNNTFYIDHGKGGNEDLIPFINSALTTTYSSKQRSTSSNTVTTDMHSSCYMRAPGMLEGVALVESIMENTAMEIGMDALEFKIKNIEKTDPKILEYLLELKQWADIDKRKEEIERFNKSNIWRKKGISVVPIKYPIEIFFNYGVLVSIYHCDGSVAISHGGIEIGQGINTKAIQTCAYKLGIPMEKIAVKPSNNLIGANSGMTGASLASEGVCWAVSECCEILLERMKPIKESMSNPTWEELVKKSHRECVNLVANTMYSKKAPKLAGYSVYAACAAEIELDVLTGQHLLNRVDILNDAGDSMNPEIDVGQIEGAFVMGIGYFTTEQTVVGKNGEILTNRTWNYTPPGVKDIPIDFRVKLPGRNPNPVGVLKSKAVGEPAICVSVAVPLAIRNAVASVRKYFDKEASAWYPFVGPSTVDNTFINCLHNYEKYTL